MLETQTRVTRWWCVDMLWRGCHGNNNFHFFLIFFTFELRPHHSLCQQSQEENDKPY